MQRLLKLGALAGLVGGVALALFLRLVGEGPIGRAVALEAARADAAGAGTAHDEMFSRATQQVGGMLGAALYGVCAGAILAVVFALVRHRLGSRDDWHRALTVAGAAFVAVSLVPALKYPANPPAVGDPDTINERTLLYVVMIGWSLVALWAGWRLLRWLRVQERPEHVRLPAAVGLWAALVAVGYVVLPGTPDAVDAPATLVWQFRVASLGGEAVFWGITGCVLGWLLVRRAPGSDSLGSESLGADSPGSEPARRAGTQLGEAADPAQAGDGRH
jgi:predicted cobalt transporter CbtA